MESNAHTPQPSGLRHRIAEIKLEPVTHVYPVSLKVLVDDIVALRLPRVDRNRPLHWENIPPCEATSASRLVLRVYEQRAFTKPCVGSVAYTISDVTGRLDISLTCDSRRFVVTFTFPVPKPHEEVAAEALSGAQGMQRRKTLLGKLSQTRAAIEKIRRLGSTVVQLLPASEAALAICSKAWEKLEAQEECDRSVETLVEGLSDIFPYAEAVKKTAKLPQLQKNILALLSLIEDASRFIVDYKMDGRAVQTIPAFVKSTAHEQVEDILKKLQELKEEFDRGVNVQTLQTVDMSARYLALDKLQPVGQAKYDPTRACMPGTRQDIIQDIFGWTQDPDIPNTSPLSKTLFWLHGHAGLGKSAIANSVCQLLDNKQLLATSFFCKRDDPQRRDPQRVLTTIIHGLAVHHPAYASAVATQLQKDGSLYNSPMQIQYDKLVRDILGSSTAASPITCLVIVVDALDECGDEDDRRQLLGCLQRMSQLVSWLKIVVTSRPYKDIEEVFHQSITTSSIRDLFQYDASDDIHTFIQQRLASSKRSKLLPVDATDTLSQRAGGLFIWAHTACQFVLGSHNPRERLDVLLEGNGSSHPSSALDDLYATAIRVSMDDTEADNTRIVSQCLGVIIACSTRAPLSVATLSDLLGDRMNEVVLQSVVDSLSSVLYIDYNKNDAVRVYHPSFADYLISPGRSREFWVDITRQNTTMAEACMRTMASELKFNICALETSSRRNRDVQDLGERIRNRISRRLEYSCLYWTSHLINAERETDILPGGYLLSDILAGPRALYWIEVLSLESQLAIALPSIQHLRVWCEGTNMLKYARDLYHFVRTFYYPISESTPHLYSSGLSFLPTATTITQLRQESFPKTIKLLGQIDPDWSPWLQCISHGTKAMAVAVSPDSRHIVSGSSNGIVRMWDVDTGALVGDPLVGHLNVVASVAFSPDGRRIASSSYDKTIRVWDVNTGALIGSPLVEHPYCVYCVAFSPDGLYIAHGTSGNAVRIWDGETSTSTGSPFVGKSGRISSVAFSKDGRYIASGSMDGVQLWNASDVTPIGKLHSGHSFDVTSVAFSPDNRFIASGSKDKTIRIWDLDKLSRTDRTLVGHSGHVNSVAFSPDGRHIASGSKDNTVRIWNLDSGATSNISLIGHSSWVNCVTFSPDGQFIVSGSNDNTIRVWDAHTTTPTNDSFGHSGEVYCVAFSRDGRRIVSGSADKTVRIWDANTGAPTCAPLAGHKKQVNSVAFSHDGCFIISASDDQALRLWNSETGAPVRKPLVGHSGPVSSVAFSPDGCRAVSGSWDKKVRIWDIGVGAPAGDPLAGHSGWVECVAFSNDGRRIISGSTDHTIRIWDADTGVPIGAPLLGHSEWVLYAAFSLDGHVVSSSLDLTIRVWDEQTRTQVNRKDIPHKYQIRSVALSPDGHYAVTGSDGDYVVRVWDANTGTPLGDPLAGHSGRVRSVAFSPDSRYIVSGSDDGTVRVWNTINTSSQISRSVSRVSGQCAADGWVYAGENDLLFWLPPECRRNEPDDSLFSIALNSTTSNVWLDYSDFVHGTDWAEIVGSTS